MAVSSQVVTSQLPAAFETYYKEGAEGSKGLIPQAFQLYGQGTPEAFQKQYLGPLQAAGLAGAGRVAGLSPTQQQLGQQIGQLGTPTQFAAGTSALQQGVGGLAGLLNQQAQAVNAPSLTAFQLGLPDTFGSAQAQQYMSPFMQNVVQIQQRKAIEDAQKSQLGANLGAVRQGTYGGARQTLAQTERERGLREQLGDIQARGLEAAFGQSQQQFERDRAAQQQTAIQNLQAALNVQQLGAGQGLEAQRANQAAALQAAQQRAQSAIGLGQMGQQFGQLGVAQQAADIDRLKTLGAYGDLERALAQQGIDARFADLARGIEFPEMQLDRLSGFIRGIPMSDKVETTTTPPPSFASQLSSMGIAGLGLYRELAKGG